MFLTRHHTAFGPRWAADGQFLTNNFDLRMLLAMPRADMQLFIDHTLTGERISGPLLAPIEMTQEVWGSYTAESVAARPALFFKAVGWRTVGHQQPVHIRADGAWNVAEPALALVINQHREIAGYTIGNDLAARSLINENPLYFSQGEVYDASCALGPGLQLFDETEVLHHLTVTLEIMRALRSVYHDEMNTARLTRRFEDLIASLFRELSFPHGALLLVGTGLVPLDNFTLAIDDTVKITIGTLTLENTVA